MTAIRIGIPQERDGTINIEVDGELPEHEQIWLWDTYFAATLHELADDEAGTELREDMASWSVNMAGKVFLPRDEISEDGIVRIEPGLEVAAGVPDDTMAVFELEVMRGPSDWPGLRLVLPDDEIAVQRCRSVMALAQYFLDHNPLFLRELPLHVLAMQKFYTEEMSPAEEESVAEAPVYALNKAMQYFEDRKRELEQPVELVRH